MNITPATKTHDIQTQLVPFLDANKELSEFEFKRYEKEANSIPDYSERNVTLGLLYAIQKDDCRMEQHFENALSYSFNLTTLSNYSSLLNRRSLFKERRSVLNNYKKDLNTPGLLKHFLEIASIYLDSDMADFVCKKAIEIKCDKFFVDAFYLRQKQIADMKKMITCSDAHVELLSDICSNILRKYNQICGDFALETIAGGHCAFGVDTDNIDIIVDMNFELADRVSETVELDSCKLTAVFRPFKKVEL